MKKIFSIFLILAFVLALTSCGEAADDSEPVKLSFQAASSYDYLKKLDGKKVSISGYLATSSPADGSFIFLMNLPYQNCPFCKPNTSQLSNTMEVYPEKGKSFDYTTQAVKVTGILEVSESEDKPFTDKYDYEFCFKITDASYKILKDSELSADMALWQKLAQTDVVNDIYDMYDYVYFLCAWNTYFVNSTDEYTGYYLYAADALNFIQTDGAQYNYGYKDGYFENIIKTVEKVDAQQFGELTANIAKAEALADKALYALQNGEYTYQKQYVEKFGTYDDIYTINEGESFTSEFDELYLDFVNWLSSWEM